MSYYKLSISCDPGGCHFHSVTRLTSLEKIKQELINNFGGFILYLFCWYGCDIILDVYKNRKKTHRIVVNNYVKVLIDKIAIVGYTEEEGPIYYSLDGLEYVGEEFDPDGGKYYLRQIICSVTSVWGVDIRDKFRKIVDMNKIIVSANENFLETDDWIPDIKNHTTICLKEYFYDMYKKIGAEKHMEMPTKNINKHKNFKIYIDFDSMNIPGLTGKKLSENSKLYGQHFLE